MNADYHVINNLIVSYAELFDEGQFGDAADLFVDATVSVAGSDTTVTGPDASSLLTDIVQRYDGIPGTKHIVSNLVIDIDPRGDSATARSYYVALQARPGLPLQPILAGRWHDKFAKTDGRWHFTERLIYSDLVGDISHHVGVS